MHSQVFVVGRSLDVLDVGLLLGLDAVGSELLVGNTVLAIATGASASPVPVHATSEFQTGHLLIGEVGEDLDHVATVAINAVHIVIDEVGAPDTQLEKGGAAEEATNNPLGLHRVAID